MSAPKTSLEIGALRRKLASKSGPLYWRSLEEAAETPEFLAFLREAFPRIAEVASASLDRRRFLEITAAPLLLSALSSCGPREPAERQLWPYVVQPPGIVPGKASYYTTATVLEGFGTGVMLKHEMGRPLKVEGNPDHGASLGATGAIEQASLLDFYDPHRAQSITARGELKTWQDFIRMLLDRRSELATRGGEGLRLLTGTITSPTLSEQIGALQRQFPNMRWHQWEALHRDAQREGARLAFGRIVDTVYDLSAADIVVGIGSDLLDTAPGHLRYARDFAARRRAGEAKARMSRVYALESTPTLLGAKADHRIVLEPEEIRSALRYIAASLGRGPEAWRTGAPNRPAIAALVKDLIAHRGNCLVQAGREQPADIHATVHAINDALASFASTLRTIEPVEASPLLQADSFKALMEDAQGGAVDTLLVLDVNFAYNAPADIDAAHAVSKIPFSIYLGAYDDETAALCTWHVPAAHTFESWGDVRAYDGTATIQQPQSRPLYGGHSAHEILAVLLGNPDPDDHALVQAHWRAQTGSSFEDFWNDALKSGVVPDSAAAPAPVTLRANYADALSSSRERPGLTVLFRPDLGLWDGRFAANAWLQEMPRPLTRLTWDNAALIAPATAERLNVSQGEIVEVAQGGRRLRAPVWILPGQAKSCITLRVGYGRAKAGPVGNGVGFNAYPMRSAGAPWEAAGATISSLVGARHGFAAEQHHALIEGRDLIREGKLSDFLADPQVLAQARNEQSLYPPYPYDGVAWGMSISLDSCIGCQACVIACQAENNIPVVGKAQVGLGRAMHWLRIDRYYTGNIDEPSIAFQPVPCMHCEDAPCEVVCPVHATVHDHEGLNVMVYNRCVGTRFCSNNCPYKVRRFNWFGYSRRQDRPRDSWNPDVSVRDRGVMEKCTYCIQRCREGLIDSDKENRPLADGEVVTACQQACPTQAIIFGNQNDKSSAVAKRKASPLDYVLLEELNTRPRTSYEALVRNPNPDIDTA